MKKGKNLDQLIYQSKSTRLQWSSSSRYFLMLVRANIYELYRATY